MNAAIRTVASPYARRLARERGVALAGLTGSGPGGRIVAGDVPLETIKGPVALPEAPLAAATPAPAAPAPIPLAAPARATGAFAATLDLATLAKLSADFGVDLPLGAFLVKAASRAAGAAADLISWRSAAGSVTTLARASALAPTEIARLIGEGASASIAGKTLALSLVTERGLRPASAALPAEADLRIVVSAAPGAPEGDALLIYDENAIGEAEAAKILAAFRDLIEAPLRLLV